MPTPGVARVVIRRGPHARHLGERSENLPSLCRPRLGRLLKDELSPIIDRPLWDTIHAQHAGRAASTIRDSRARARTNRQPCDFDGELTERAGQSPAVADYSAFLAIAERNSRAVIDRGNDNGQRALMLRVIHERDRKFADSLVEGAGFEPSVPDRTCSSAMPPTADSGPPSFGGEGRLLEPPQQFCRFAKADDCPDDTATPRVDRPQLG